MRVGGLVKIFSDSLHRGIARNRGSSIAFSLNIETSMKQSNNHRSISSQLGFGQAIALALVSCLRFAHVKASQVWLRMASSIAFTRRRYF